MLHHAYPAFHHIGSPMLARIIHHHLPLPRHLVDDESTLSISFNQFTIPRILIVPGNNIINITLPLPLPPSSTLHLAHLNPSPRCFFFTCFDASSLRSSLTFASTNNQAYKEKISKLSIKLTSVYFSNPISPFKAIT